MGFWKNIGNSLKNEGISILNTGAKTPVTNILTRELDTVVTSIGEFIVRKIKDNFQRAISFQIGLSYGDSWMEEALYGILYKYNNIKNSRELILCNDDNKENGEVYYRLKDGMYNLKYRNYDIALYIETENIKNSKYRPQIVRSYTLITYNLSEQFVKDFESDMIKNRDSLLKISSGSPFTNVYQDEYDDGYVYWWKNETIPKRKLNTIYIPRDQKIQLVTSINRFFERKKFYLDNGIPHNLKILLYGPAGSGLNIATKFF